MENKLFNLEKIKEITNPIEDLESKAESIERLYNKMLQNYDQFRKIIPEDTFYRKLNPLLDKLSIMHKEIIELSKSNISGFLVFQDYLIKKFKDSFKESLRKLNLNHEVSKKIGLYLIENRKISTIISEATFIPAISINQWLELIDSLDQNSLFLSVIRKIRVFYSEIIEEKLEKIINTLPEDTDKSLIEAYKNAYQEEQISFQEFLNDYESKLTKEQLKSKEALIKKTNEQKKLKQLKKKQEEQKQNFNDYFKYSQKEFQRILRKKKRKKLSDIDQKPEVHKEISEEVFEKIEKFKSKFEKKFEEDLLIKKDDEKNPLELIRERKKKKDEEYKDFIRRFTNED
ncbi:MAG: hypothetical protein ACTSR8_13805 [Promethearchaeota archaeon]